MRDKDCYKDKDNCKFCFPPMSPYTRLAHASIPTQTMNKVFNPREALRKGTLFPELYEPYEKGVYCK